MDPKELEGIKHLRAKLGVTVKDALEAYRKCNGDLVEAANYLMSLGRGEEKPTEAGMVFTYHHPPDLPRYAAILEVRCGTDFVARTAEFRQLVKDLAIQVIVGDHSLPLADQEFVKDPTRTVGDLLQEHSRKFGETITVPRWHRWIFAK